jgi:hypothetical protein
VGSFGGDKSFRCSDRRSDRELRRQRLRTDCDRSIRTATGYVVDRAEAEINLKLTTVKFQGTLTAWAQSSVRVLIPPGFQTPFQAVVNRPQDFVCRTEFSTAVKREKKGGLYMFTYAGDRSVAPDRVDLRSEHATVVIDTTR